MAEFRIPKPLQRSIVLDKPERLSSPSAWESHIPFAFWLTEVHRPRVFVELGTHAGNSYFAFVQAIKQLKISSQCFAVDTWQGDEHAGFYAEDVFKIFSSYHDQHFSAFSRFIRSTFDEALGYFGDTSVDLLHIDGCHTYDAVKHDFHNWLPKLSAAGVVLFHDTNVREKNFGVWKFWEEIRDRYPHFEFKHGNGLGVLGVGKKFSPDLNWLFDLPQTSDDSESTIFVRSFFEGLGIALSERLKLNESLSEINVLRGDRERVHEELSRQIASGRSLQKQVAEQKEQVAEQKEQVAQISARSMKLREDLAQQTAINEQLRHELSLLNAEYVQLNLQLSQRIESILHSSSWRLTSPIRALSERMRIVLRKIGGLFRGQSKSRRPQEEKNLIGNSGLFDRDWYLTQINDEASAQIDPLSHYVDRGASEGRNPNPLFDTAWYLTQYPDVAAAKHNPLLHYLSYGAAEGRDPHPLFDTDWYQMQNPDVVAAGVNPLAHYLSSGASEGRDPNQAFQTSWYLQQNPEIAATGVNPLVHYVLFGLGTSRAPNPLVPFSQVEAVRRRIEANPRYRPTPSELCGMPERALPKAIVHLLQTCHDTSAIPLIRSVYGILESYGGVEIGESDLPSYSDVEALAATISALANRDSQRETVDATIIIPVHNHIIHTLCCLQLVLSLPTRSTFEIVVADDASTDATAKLIASIGGAVRHHRNNINVGFTVNCNAAASMARGDVLVFLNNDTIPLPYWLDELIDSLRSDPSIGLVGSKLIDADGALQEAGGIVWNDGTAWNYGRGGNAIAPEFNYVKDADYISGACIAIQKNLWDKLSGFDEIYAPAYYEDVDLAFRVRAAGLRTVYQPFSGVVHHEGVSHGRDTTVGLKSYQVRNGQIFFEKWQSNLSSEHLPPGTDIQFARDRSKGRPRILFIDHGIPEPDRDAGSRALDDYIKLFVSKKFHVTFLPQNRRFDRQYTTRLQRIGVEVVYDNLDYVFSLEKWLATNGSKLDYIFVSRPEVANEFIDRLRRNTNAKILFSGVDIHYQRYARQVATTNELAAKNAMIAHEIIEKAVWSKSDVVYYFSEEERDLVISLCPGKPARAIPLLFYKNSQLNEVRARILKQGIATTNQLLFVGGFRHQPNVDAMLWFSRDVWPRILANIPDAKLCIAGSFPPPEVQALAGKSTIVTGYITDEVLRLLYSVSSVSIVPLRYGAGVKGKVFEALSQGMPLVTTSTGVQGINGAAKFAEICDTADAFSSAVIEILHNPKSRVEKILAGLDFLDAAASEKAAQEILALDVPEIS